MLYAHSKGEDQSDWQPLSEHLENVAELSAQFAAAFGYGQWGRALGLLHDAGKVCDRFQKERLFNRPVSVDHAAFGARRALELYGGRGDKNDAAGTRAYAGELMAYAILGHHGGMKSAIPDAESRIERLDSPPDHGQVADDYGPYQDMLRLTFQSPWIRFARLRTRVLKL